MFKWIIGASTGATLVRTSLFAAVVFLAGTAMDRAMTWRNVVAAVFGTLGAAKSVTDLLLPAESKRGDT